MIPQSKKSSRQRDLETNLVVNPIEDGNTPADSINQGYIYTSEINQSGYEYAYKSLIYSITQEKGTTGTNYYYVLEVGYTLEQEGPLDTPEGFFGSNLIKNGEPFTIVSDANIFTSYFNYIKGYVVNVIDVYPGLNVWPTEELVYKIRIAITEGDMSSLDDGGTGLYPGFFCTNRRIFTDNNLQAPVNLDISVNQTTDKVLFSWSDPTNLAVSYRFRLRSEDTVTNDIYDVTGNNPNFNGVLEPILEGGSLKSVKIVDPGYSYSLNVPFFGGSPINVQCNEGATFPPIVLLYPSNCGSLTIDDYVIVDVTNVTTNQVTCILKKNNNSISPNAFNLPNPSMYIEFGNEFGDGYVITASLLDEKISTTIKLLNNITYTLSQAQEALIGKTIKVHTGVWNTPGSSNISKIKFSYDKYKEGIKFYIPASYFGLLYNQGTYYFSISSVFDCEQKTYSEWSEETKFII
jgi:hypothetical protein